MSRERDPEATIAYYLTNCGGLGGGQGERHPGALIRSLPLISILAMIWLWTDTADRMAITDLSVSRFWLVIPTLSMFLVLPLLMHRKWRFFPALGTSMGIMLLCNAVAVPILARFGLSI